MSWVEEVLAALAIDVVRAERHETHFSQLRLADHVDRPGKFLPVGGRRLALRHEDDLLHRRA